MKTSIIVNVLAAGSALAAPILPSAFWNHFRVNPGPALPETLDVLRDKTLPAVVVADIRASKDPMDLTPLTTGTTGDIPNHADDSKDLSRRHDLRPLTWLGSPKHGGSPVNETAPVDVEKPEWLREIESVEGRPKGGPPMPLPPVGALPAPLPPTGEPPLPLALGWDIPFPRGAPPPGLPLPEELGTTPRSLPNSSHPVSRKLLTLPFSGGPRSQLGSWFNHKRPTPVRPSTNSSHHAPSRVDPLPRHTFVPGWGDSNCWNSGPHGRQECWTVRGNVYVNRTAHRPTDAEKLASGPQLIVVDIRPENFYGPVDLSAGQLAQTLEKVFADLFPDKHASAGNGTMAGNSTTVGNGIVADISTAAGQVEQRAEHVAVLHAYKTWKGAQPTLFEKLSQLAEAGHGGQKSEPLEHKLGYVPHEYTCVPMFGVLTCAMPELESVRVERDSVRKVAVIADDVSAD